MKIWRLLCSLLILTGVSRGADLFRTDINPALRYYQAFLLTPDLPEKDHEYLFVQEWRGQNLDERFGGLISKYDNTFKLIRQAGAASVPCDWGIDLSEGPNALLPGLARAKAVAQTARLRVLWHLQNGREQEARDDLLAAFVLARNTSKDGVLISALVQYAMEHIVISIVAENFSRFSPQTLRQLVAGCEASPTQGSIADCVRTEKIGFYDWLLRKIEEARRESGGDDAKAFAQIRYLLNSLESEEASGNTFAEKILDAAGGSIERLLALTHQLEPLYERAFTLMKLPYKEFAPAIQIFNKEVREHDNPLVPVFFTLFEKCRLKEFAAQVDLAMVQAAVSYKLEGAAGLRSVKDPCGDGPFYFERFVFDGVDRGFKLKSALTGRGFDEIVIFVENDGPPFQIMGKNAGRPARTSPEAK